MTWQLLARMPDGSIGGLLSGWTASLTLRFNEVGSWSVEVPPEATPAGWPAPGAGLVFLRDGEVVASGMIDETAFEWSANPGDDSAGYGKFSLAGDTDLARLGYRIVYPSPSATWDGTLNPNHSFESGIGGYARGGSGTISSSTEFAFAGERSAKLAADGRTTTFTISSQQVVPASTGQPFEASAWVYAPSPLSRVWVAVIWHDLNGNAFALSQGAETAVPAGQWTYLSAVGSAPTNAHGATIRVAVLDVPKSGATLYVDEARLRRASASQSAAYWTYGPDVAEEVLRVMVNQQAGSIASPERRVPGLRLGTPTGVGTRVSAMERFTPLLDAMRKIALAGGGLAFDVRDALDGGMEFVVWQPQDRTRTARFGVELGNVQKLNVVSSTATANAALIAGQGEKEERELYEFRSDGFDRREVFVDQRQVSSDGSDAERIAEYAKAANETLAESGPQSAVSAVLLDTESVRWRRDYDLGDRVSILTPFGPVEDLVRAIEIKVDATGFEEITSTIGTTQASVNDPLASTVAALQRRVSYLERAQ